MFIKPSCFHIKVELLSDAHLSSLKVSHPRSGGNSFPLTFFTISKFWDSQMLRITISPYSDHSVNLSRPVCQKMVQIWFFTFKYHSIWHQKLNCKWKNLRMDIMDRKTYRKPGIVGVQSKTSPKYRKYRTNKPTQKRFAMDIFCTFLALVHWSSIINHNHQWRSEMIGFTMSGVLRNQ